MTKKVLIDQLQIPNPCSASWDSMIGDDRIRFCEHCDLTVHNISQLTSKEVLRLVAASNGRLCVNYYVRPEAVTKLPGKLHQIAHRVSRVAAGAFSATLAVTGSTASGSPSPARPQTNAQQVTQPVRTSSPTSSVIGTVTDQTGARISSASVSLSNDQTNLALYTSANNLGEYRFEGLEPGTYSLRIEAPGFAPADVKSFYVGSDDESRVDQTLRVESIEASVDVEGRTVHFQSLGGAVAVIAPSDPFIRAVQENHMQAVISLLAGHDVNMRDKSSGTTALEHAARNANREMVQLLISSGADVNAKNEAGQTPLMMLDNDATSDLVWDLINSGAKVDAKDSEGNTPLMEAARINNLDLIKTLLEAGAEVNASNKHGQTALMIAASEGLVNNLRALILAGAEINRVDSDGKSALEYATEYDHAAVARLLRSQGVEEKVAVNVEKN